MTIVSVSKMSEVGKLFGSISACVSIRFFIDSMARCVSMLVYIEMASAEKFSPPLGIVRSFSSCITVVESFT